jgi:peroxiredoxin
MKLPSHPSKLISRVVTSVTLLGAFALVLGSAKQDVVANSPAEAKPLTVGCLAPNSTLRGLDGKPIQLKAVLGHKPTVLIFYRGGWCPFCNAHLSDLAHIEPEVRRRGYQIIAISPDVPAELNKMHDKNHLTYRLFSDSSAEAMKKFGVAFRLDDATFTKYRDDYKVDLEKYSGQGHHILPVPSVFVIDKSGSIRYAHSNPDYKVRLKGSELLQVLDQRP